MLKVIDLYSGYDGAEILFGVCLEVHPGEVVALIGPNGAGKSTVLNSIFSLAKIYHGNIFFNGKDITRCQTHELVDLGIGFVPQGRQIFPNLTVFENLLMGAFTSPKHDVEAGMDEIFRRHPILKEKKKEFARNLSDGQQQILAIARVLMRKPKMLLLDEPSLGLMPKVTKEIFNAIEQIADEGIAVLIVEQNVKQAVGIADRTYILENGKVVKQGNIEVLKDKEIMDVYFGGDIDGN